MFCSILSFLTIGACLTSPPPESTFYPDKDLKIIEGHERKNWQSIVYPDKNLTEITIHGSYYPENKEKRKKIIEELIENGDCATDNSCPHSPHYLLEGESLEEALNSRYLYVGKEHFYYVYSSYCYKEKENKKYHMNKNLKARLYSQEGELLTESFLRLKKRNNENSYLAKTYLPYHEAGDKIVFVSLQGNKENVFFETQMMTQDDLQNRSTSSERFRGQAWFFHKQIECHSSPNII